MKYGVFLPNFGPFGEVDRLIMLATAAEDAGWDGFFLWDHLLFDGHERPVADPWVALAAVAVATESLRIGTVITPVPRRRPWKLARETTTLDQLSGGRLTLGVGLGFPPELEFGTFGEEVDGRRRADMLDEGLEVLDGLWSGEPFSFQGEHYTVGETTFDRPVQRPRIPIWCAGWWPNRRPFRRAARWDGVAPELVGGATPGPEDVRAIHTYVGEHRESDAPFDIVVNGHTDEAEPSRMAEYEDAGATWWLERFDPDRLYSFDEALGRIKAGTLHGRDVAGGRQIQKGTR